MATPDLQQTRPSPPQIHYADLLFSGSWYTLFIMLITYLMYIGDLVSAYVPLPALPSYWHLPAREYLTQARVPDGWNWLQLAGHGDFLTLSAIALLLSLSLLCPLILLLSSWRRGDRMLVVVLVLELSLLGLAAAGILTPVRY